MPTTATAVVHARGATAVRAVRLTVTRLYLRKRPRTYGGADARAPLDLLSLSTARPPGARRRARPAPRGVQMDGPVSAQVRFRGGELPADGVRDLERMVRVRIPVLEKVGEGGQGEGTGSARHVTPCSVRA